VSAYSLIQPILGLIFDVAGYSAVKPKPKRPAQAKGIKEKPFEFALLNSKEDDTEDDFLKKEMVVERGMVTLTEHDS